MTNDSLDTQLEKYLSDAYSIEKQALVQMKMAPGIAGDPKLAKLFEDHLHETEGHEHTVGERLEAHGGSPSTVKNLVMEAGGVGFALFAKFQPDTPGKLVAHAHSYEALEEASYELLAQVAERAGDQETVEAARRIRDEESRSDGTHTPIVALTALALAGDRERCLSSGMDDYMTKPVRAAQLAAAVQRWAGARPGL